MLDWNIAGNQHARRHFVGDAFAFAGQTHPWAVVLDDLQLAETSQDMAQEIIQVEAGLACK